MTATSLSDANERRTVLGVTRSSAGRIWRERIDGTQNAQALALSQRTGLPDVVGKVLIGRDVGLEEADRFLDPSLKDLMPDPSSLQDMDKAATRIADALHAGTPLAVFGDYDVDGATSTALLLRYFRALNVEPQFYIPDRIIDGYGPNPTAISQLHDGGARLLITVDCGSTSFEAFDEARRVGLEVVVIDHHQVGETFPDVTALVNPNRQDDLSGQGHLAAVGVTFLFLVALNRELRKRGVTNLPDLMALLDLVALGTVCDVVPLKGLNRAYVVKGLQVMHQRRNVGLAALADISRVNGKPTPYHLGFMLGPRINAGGRIGDSALGAKLLVSGSREEAEHIAATLERLNQERQAIEAIMLEEGEGQAFQKLDANGEPPAILLTGADNWHPGVVGLIASRLKERYRRPSFAIAFNEEGVGTGSGRSITGVDLGAAVRAAVEAGLLEKGGGHAMAAGLTVKREKLAEVEAFLSAQLSEAVGIAAQDHELTIDGVLAPSGATLDLLETLERAGPYGASHPEPIFAFPSVRIKYADVIGKGHVRVTIATNDGGNLKAIAFKAEDQPLGRALLEARGKNLHLAGVLSIDTWQGQAKAQLRILDAADPTTSTLARMTGGLK
ncbi:single-stranded-DNA-specific exonuclease RecJ [Pseudovibrio exalbescens]|uniref:single-stranded-DNA-specific exonuclease RecJ n=1 Tax=Pseudovibrio exalbescens TaxID=197461 RepID=UPI0023664B46|nr:single-stranded-DNA-specific exonuclease RecJ [Pseudovibrio exalbescens]MDD7908430.1 single-stranded-DNA-specific exonuclease RecJ [Pseudovibrio exalbescens]